MVIKAIETEYKGYRFRSRLEARWAVFFETLGLDWEYEIEGFELGYGDLYLPDFWLSDVNMWAEVKAGELSPAERRKCELLVKGTGHPCLMLIGTPEGKPYTALEVIWDGEEFEFIKVRYCLTKEHIDEGKFYCWEYTYDPGSVWWIDTAIAVTAARSARFEWGQSP